MQNIHAESRPDKLRADLIDLVGFPSITGSEDESRIARHIHEKLQELPYFQDNPAHLRLIESKLPDIPRPLLAVFALVKAGKPTRKTILLISHFDVVDVQNFGSLEPLAFDPEKLAEKLTRMQLSPEVSRDLHSGGYLFGRGVMDMKLGLALEMDILEEFSRDTALYDVNIALLAVGDEENNNGGMRQGVRFLHQAARELDIDIACVVDTEPSDAGRPGTSEQMIFLGTTGKLLPFFYIQGFGSHAGSYYQGLSASLAASYLHTLIEA
ncbi:MAG: M20/M25/M40 family metallo-hydrolase, partial [Thermodesulfobacteriota bacterium]